MNIQDYFIGKGEQLTVLQMSVRAFAHQFFYKLSPENKNKTDHID